MKLHVLSVLVAFFFCALALARPVPTQSVHPNRTAASRRPSGRIAAALSASHDQVHSVFAQELVSRQPIKAVKGTTPKPSPGKPQSPSSKRKGRDHNTPGSGSSSAAATTSVYVIKQGLAPGPLFPDHWALFVGSSNPTFSSGVGNYIHVTGDVSQGFKFEVLRGYNLALTNSNRRGYLIGNIASASGSYPGQSTQFAKDAVPRTAFEHALLANNPPPGSSLGSSSSGGIPRRRVQLQNCQTWLQAGVKAAAAAGVLRLNPEAQGILSRAL